MTAKLIRQADEHFTLGNTIQNYLLLISWAFMCLLVMIKFVLRSALHQHLLKIYS